MRYDDFVIQIGPLRDDGHQVRVLHSPAGEGSGSFKPPFTVEQLSSLWLGGAEPTVRGAVNVPDAEHGRDLKHRAQLTQPDPSAVGRQLFSALFSGQVGRLYERSLGSLQGDPNRGLRIKLKVDPGELDLSQLDGLPWELLYRDETGDFLSLSRHSPIVRYLEVPQPAQAIPLPDRLRVLVVISSPSGLMPLHLERERRLLEEVLSDQPGVEVEFLEHATTGGIRLVLLERQFHVLHFMGHGGFDPLSGQGMVYLEKEDGTPSALSGLALATKLGDVKSLGLVFLNACNTARATIREGLNPFAGVANALVRSGLPAVVAMQLPISDQAAIAFSDAFYRRLAAGDSVDEALTEGRQAIHSVRPDTVEWGTPVLFVRVPDGSVFHRPPEPTPLIARTSWGVRAALAVVFLIISLLILPPTRRFFFGPASHQMTIDKVFASSVEGLEGKLKTVEILSDGRMRLHFEFTNETGETQPFGFDYARTYLADEFGNPYEVIETSTPFSGKTAYVENIPSGKSRDYWIEFPAPRDHARQLHVGLASPEPSAVEFDFFQIDLPEYPERLSVASRAPPLPAGAQPLAVGAELRCNVDGLITELAQVAVLDGDRMRFDFAFFNQTAGALEIPLDYASVRLVDEFGNVYYPTAYGIYGETGEYSEGLTLRRAVRLGHWIEFSGPRGDARSFTVRLATEQGSQIAFEEMAVDLSDYETGSSTPRPAGGLLPAPQSFVSNVEGLMGRVTAVEALANGHMRWSFRVRNGSGEDREIGLDYPATYLADELGHRYGVLASDTAADTRKESFKTTLVRSARTDHWLEFPGPREGAGTFMVVLASHDPEALAFPPFSVGPLSFPENLVVRSGEKVPPGATRLYLNRKFETGVRDLDGRLATVDLYRDGRMRWTFEIRNRSSTKDLHIGFDYGDSYLTDEHGHRYKVQQSDAGKSSGAYKRLLSRFLRAEQWLEFSAPRDQARTFEVHLAGYDPRLLSFPAFEVALPEYDPTLSVVTQRATPEVSFTLREGELEVGNDLEGLKIKLAAIERMSNKRLRWHFEFFNTSSAALEIGFDYRGTKLSDEKGNPYRLLSASVTADPAGSAGFYRTTLPPGHKMSYWFEFSGRVAGTERFILSLISHDRERYRYRPLMVHLPEVASHR